MKAYLSVLCFVIAMLFVQPLSAQDDPDFPKRYELAQKMHEIKPINMQIKSSIEQLAQRYPEDVREAFVNRMMEVFDKKTLTDISVRAMADTFTAAELEKMIDFHGSPEGKAVGEKMPVYQGLVRPELMQKIDKALMEVRTGASAQ